MTFVSWWNSWNRNHKSLKCYRLGLTFYKKVHKRILKHIVLSCSINKDDSKRTCLIDAFIQRLTHFWLGFLGSFLGGEHKIATPAITSFQYLFRICCLTYPFVKRLANSIVNLENHGISKTKELQTALIWHSSIDKFLRCSIETSSQLTQFFVKLTSTCKVPGITHF